MRNDFVQMLLDLRKNRRRKMKINFNIDDQRIYKIGL